MDPIQPDFAHQGPAKLGLEIEMFGFDARTLAPLDNPQKLMERIAAHTGHLKTDPVTGVVVGLELSCGNFSLEPGGQLEYATCPQDNLESLRQDLKMGLELLEQAGQGEVLFLDHGTNPLAGPDLGLLVPKHRYRILDRYFRSQPGGRGVDMMRFSATAQPNIDVVGEEAWHDAVRLSHALTPLARRLFANSCYFHGRKVEHSERQRIWQAIDPSRTGIPPRNYREWARQAYVFLAGDLPLEEQPLYGELTYEQWERDGYKGRFPDQQDWQTHLGTLFPDLRLRRFLEIRMVDAQSFEHALAPMAFWTTALHHARPQLWRALGEGGDVLTTVLQAAPDDLTRYVLQRFIERQPHFPDSALDFVRSEGTLRPSQKV